MTDWDKHYIYGTLRKPTDTTNMHPEGIDQSAVDDYEEMGLLIGYGLFVVVVVLIFAWVVL